MGKKIDDILDSMDKVSEQSPSAFFKERVLKTYYRHQEALGSRFETWFPWLNPRFHMAFATMVLLLNVFLVQETSRKIAYEQDLKTLEMVFNAVGNE